MKKTKILGLSFVVSALIATGGVCLGNTKVSSAENTDAVNEKFTMTEKAQMLLRDNAEESGLRFTATMSQADYLALMANEGADKDYKDISFGMVLMPADYTAYSELTFKALFSANADEKKYDWATWNGDEWVYSGENGANGSDVRIMNFTSDELVLTDATSNNPYYTMYGAVKNVLVNNYARQFVAKAYVVYTAQDNSVSYEWATENENACSVAYIAQTALQDTEGLTSTQVSLLNAYVTNASTKDTTVAVEHYQENLDGGYDLIETTSQTAKVNAQVTAESKSYIGFSVDEEATGTKNVVANALADGKSTASIYYKRNTYNVIFNTNGGSTVESVPVKYGATYVVQGETEKADETFAGWYVGNDYTAENKADTIVMGAEDITINALWLTVEWSESASSVALKYHATDAQGMENTYTLANPTVLANGEAYNDWQFQVTDSLTIEGNVIKTAAAQNGVVSVVANGSVLASKTVTVRDISAYRIIRTLADCFFTAVTENVILANDIDFNNDAYVLDSFTNWQSPWRGELDGNGYAFKNINIGSTIKTNIDGTATANNNNFLWRAGSSGYIHDLAFLNVTINAGVSNGAGILISSSNTIKNVYMEAVLIGGNGGGRYGLVGYNAKNMENVVCVVENRSTANPGTIAGDTNANQVFTNCYSISMTANPIGKTTTNVVAGVSTYTLKEAFVADTAAMEIIPEAFKAYLNEVYLGYNLPTAAQNGKQKASYTLPVVEGVSYVSSNTAIAKVENGAIVPVKGGDKTSEIAYVYAIKNGKTVASYRVQCTDYTDYTVITQSSELVNINGAKKFILAGDIDFGGVSTAAWDSGTAFSGIFDGNGFEIKNFVIGVCTWGSVTVNNNMFLFRTGSGEMTIRDITFTGKANRGWEGQGAGIVLAPINMLWNNVTVNLTYQGGATDNAQSLFGYLQPNCKFNGCTFNLEKTPNAGTDFPVYITTLVREGCAFFNCVVNSATINAAVKEYRPSAGAANVAVETKDFFGIAFNDLSQNA